MCFQCIYLFPQWSRGIIVTLKLLYRKVNTSIQFCLWSLVVLLAYSVFLNMAETEPTVFLKKLSNFCFFVREVLSLPHVFPFCCRETAGIPTWPFLFYACSIAKNHHRTKRFYTAPQKIHVYLEIHSLLTLSSFRCLRNLPNSKAEQHV